jgi:hypothetical protein
VISQCTQKYSARSIAIAIDLLAAALDPLPAAKVLDDFASP